MATFRSGWALAGAAALAVGAGLPAIAQQQKPSGPESILPPGFGEPVAPTPAPSAGPNPPARPVTAAAPGAPPSPGATLGPDTSESPTPSPTPTLSPQQLAEYEMPRFARRGLGDVGIVPAADGGFQDDAFGEADGRYLETLMRRLDAPMPSRWLSIAMRRLLLSDVSTPQHANGADFAAERAWLLLRMGEAVGARALVEQVDDADYTPKLLQIAMQAALANGDPGALCPLEPLAERWSNDRGWMLARAMCAGLAGNAGEAGRLIDHARHGSVGSGVDLLLAQKVVGAGVQGRRAVNAIDWAGVDRLNVWRYGLATATGVAIPPETYATAGAPVRFWRATAPVTSPVGRAVVADAAAGQGILSNLALVDLYGQIDAADDEDIASADVARNLRTAYAGDRDARLSAMTALWTGSDDALARYGRLVLTARAAAGIAPQSGTDAADRLIASMLSAGLVTAAEGWSGAVSRGSDGWAMLTLADPGGAQTDYGAIGAYNGDEAKRRMFFAALAGLGRLADRDVERGARDLDVRIGAENSWTAALNRAVRSRQPGTVMVLAAIGMQTPGWRGVPPATLYRALAAMRATGLDDDARMIAAEAIARL